MSRHKKKLRKRDKTIYKRARPMQVILDEQGECWICDMEVNPRKDLRSQQCIPCGELTLTRPDQDFRATSARLGAGKEQR